MITDNEIIMKHDKGCRHRASMELKIVNCILTCAEKAGYELSIPDYEEDIEGEEYKKDIKAALFNLDDACLVFHKDNKRVGWVYLVFGNSGYDLINDYPLKMEEFLQEANDLADKLEEMS